jgi:outer membrane protein
MKNKSLIILALLFSHVVVAQRSAGDSTATRDWTLQECIKTALDNNLNVKRSVYNVESSEVGYWQAKMAFLPTLNGSGSYSKSYGRSLNPVSNQFITRNINNINLSATGNLTLFNGMRLQNSLRQSKRDYLASGEDLRKAQNDVIINVSTLYINVIFAQELYDNARFQLASSQVQLERITKQVAAGALPKAEQLNQEAQVATNEVNLVNQENGLNLALLQLKQAMQLPASIPMRVEVPDLSADDLVLDQTPEEIYAIAENVMPEIRAAVLRVESADYALKSARGGLYPRVALQGSAQTNYSSASDGPIFEQDGTTSLSDMPVGETASGEQIFPYQEGSRLVSSSYGERDQLQDNLSKSIGIGVTIPIFNGWQTRGSVQRAVISKSVADINAEQARNTLRQTIETSYNDALAASKTYSSALKQVNAREEAYRMTKQRYELGAVNYVEYQIAENNLFQAKSDLARAKYNFIFRKKILDLYQGKTIEY